MAESARHIVAVFSDIHSNYQAFRACFEDARLHGAECFIFLGDYVSDLSEARATMDLVYRIRSEHPTHCLRGNRERYMLEHRKGANPFAPGSKTGSLLFTYQQLRPEDLNFFESLPIYSRIELYGIPFEIAHAAKNNDRQYYTAEDPSLQAVFSQMDAPFLLAGHSHIQYLQSDGIKTVINPGSIGVPRGYGYLAQYALLEIGEGSVRCEFRQLPYDLEAAIRSQFESGLTDLAKYWAVGVLYDIITGEEYTMELLARIYRQSASVHDEQVWHRTAAEIGMRFTQAEILSFFRERSAMIKGSGFTVLS